MKQIQTLEHAGFDRQQIEALIEVIGHQVHAAVSSAMANLVTRDDLEKFATEDSLDKFATKEDFEKFATKEDLEKFATKDDFEKCATKEDLEKFATKDDFEKFATKDDLYKIITRILMWVPAVMFGTIIATAATVTLLIRFLA